jgi:5-methyltetrahydrofolate--homocysteine methyltransferase
MGTVGEKFSSGEYFLPDMLMAARAMNSCLEVLKPLLDKTGIPTIGKVVIGTVEGDMHDIGKNVVATFLKGSGFEVFDLGLNVSDKKFIDEVREKKADILGLSALLTTTMPFMSRIIKALDAAGLRSSVKVIVGGAPVTQDYANYIGADAYAHDGGKAITVCKQLVGK